MSNELHSCTCVGNRFATRFLFVLRRSFPRLAYPFSGGCCCCFLALWQGAQLGFFFFFFVLLPHMTLASAYHARGTRSDWTGVRERDAGLRIPRPGLRKREAAGSPSSCANCNLCTWIWCVNIVLANSSVFAVETSKLNLTFEVDRMVTTLPRDVLQRRNRIRPP